MKPNFFYAIKVNFLLATLFFFPVAATADSYDVDVSSVVIDSTGNYTISGSGGTSNTIRVGAHVTATVTLQDVNINTADCAFKLDVGARVTLILLGNNTLTSGDDYAGLQVTGSATLEIRNGVESSGTLTVTGGKYSAGIGGNSGTVDGGGVTVTSGTVIATGGLNGAGIGGGIGGGCTVVINGGTVTATGGRNGAGIGGNAGTIIINGGTVFATGTGAGAGIGSGSGDNAGTIVINGGIVTATGGDTGAGIGNGAGGAGGNVTIAGGTVTATGYGNGININDADAIGQGSVVASGSGAININDAGGVAFKRGSEATLTTVQTGSGAINDNDAGGVALERGSEATLTTVQTGSEGININDAGGVAFKMGSEVTLTTVQTGSGAININDAGGVALEKGSEATLTTVRTGSGAINDNDAGGVAFKMGSEATLTTVRTGSETRADGGGGSVTIKGGSVKASISPQPVNGERKLRLADVDYSPALVDSVIINSIDINAGGAYPYGAKDMKVRDGGRLYLWLPEEVAYTEGCIAITPVLGMTRYSLPFVFCSVNFALQDNTDGKDFSVEAFYRNGAIASGEAIASGGGLVIRALGENVENYRYKYEWSGGGIPAGVKRNGSELAIPALEGNTDVVCTVTGPWYTVKFPRSTTGIAYKGTYNRMPVLSGDSVRQGGRLEVSIVFNGESGKEYKYLWTGEGIPAGVVTDGATLAFSGLSGDVDVSCRISGPWYSVGAVLGDHPAEFTGITVRDSLTGALVEDGKVEQGHPVVLTAVGGWEGYLYHYQWTGTGIPGNVATDGRQLVIAAVGEAITASCRIGGPYALLTLALTGDSIGEMHIEAFSDGDSVSDGLVNPDGELVVTVGGGREGQSYYYLWTVNGDTAAAGADRDTLRIAPGRREAYHISCLVKPYYTVSLAGSAGLSLAAVGDLSGEVDVEPGSFFHVSPGSLLEVFVKDSTEWEYFWTVNRKTVSGKSLLRIDSVGEDLRITVAGPYIPVHYRLEGDTARYAVEANIKENRIFSGDTLILTVNSVVSATDSAAEKTGADAERRAVRYQWSGDGIPAGVLTDGNVLSIPNVNSAVDVTSTVSDSTGAEIAIFRIISNSVAFFITATANGDSIVSNSFVSRGARVVVTVNGSEEGSDYTFQWTGVGIPADSRTDTNTLVIERLDSSLVVNCRVTVSESPNAVKAPEAAAIKTRVAEGTLYVAGLTRGAAWVIYNVAGVPLKRGVAAGNNIGVRLPGRGVYLFCSGRNRIKLINKH
jgi:hypothetical protein